jgi:hypothetical protein
MTAVTAEPVEATPIDRSLPTWPITIMFVPYLLWWALGIGDGIWGLFAVPMVVYLAARSERVRVPRGFGLWLLFFGWMCVSVIEIDSAGRLLGFLFRAMIYFGATVAFIYVYNCDRRLLTVDRIAKIMTAFWVLVVVGGYLALLLPHGMITTPMSYLTPGGVAQNDLVQQMIRPRFTQGDPNGYYHLALRPSAPFAFTNAWGTNFTLTLPFVFITLARMRRGPGFWALAGLIPISLVPAFSTQNRGMLLALGVGVGYVALREIKRGRVAGIAAVVFLLLAASVMSTVVPVDQLIQQRVSASDTNATRLSVYNEAITRTLESPLIGRGAPRPSKTMGAPSVGTQGQFWMVLFSHGFVGVALFMAWFISLAVRTRRAIGSAGLWMHTIVVMMTLESLYYGMMGSALVITMITGAVLLREQAAEAEPEAGEPPAGIGAGSGTDSGADSSAQRFVSSRHRPEPVAS